MVPEDLEAAVSSVEFQSDPLGLAGSYKAVAEYQESREDLSQGQPVKSPSIKCQVCCNPRL